ncbi:Aste57867_1150 [Aphanomyces stellatus]|uniref:Aste57867_1150 protein n=1 Tax=Aphanomyces stellatus TaxID=120398 RepID=A0A485K9Y6_9STRA|nr:hypothetical protein As57867_001149 [Aphanomyces stellatus]VFT78370.1 Aste57867_1150 [Aphanomyces stellatus]
MRIFALGLFAAVAAADCGRIFDNSDFVGGDLSQANAGSAAECCPHCDADPQCSGFAFSNGVCWLKLGQLERVDKPGVQTAVIKSSPSKCGAIEQDVDYFGNDIECDHAMTSTDACCDKCSANAACKVFVVSNFGCCIKSSNADRRPNQNPGWNVRAGARVGSSGGPKAKISSSTYAPDVRVTAVPFTSMPGYQWIANSNLESLDDQFDALVKAINASLATHHHGAKPEVLVEPSADGSKVLPFTSVESMGECAALVSSHGMSFFTYMDDPDVCFGHSFPGDDATNFLTQKASVSMARTVPDNFSLQAVATKDDAACIAKCKATAGCMASRRTDKCYMFGPATARAQNIYAGYVTADFQANTVPNLPSTIDNPDAVHFYTTAHQDDHELFMSNVYHKSISNPKTKVVFVYATAGNDHAGDGYREARELGSLAATTAWVDHVGKFDSAPQSDSVQVLDREITRITIGNVVSYFLRIPEYVNNDYGFMKVIWNQGAVAPMDSDNAYGSRDELKSVLATIYAMESDGIATIVHNAQDPEGEQPDHEQHLATGQLVADILAEDDHWSQCVPQNYFYDYQRWFNDVNVDATVRKLQRYAWLRLSQAIYSADDSILFWSEHSINLGRTYIRRSVNEGAGPC